MAGSKSKLSLLYSISLETSSNNPEYPFYVIADYDYTSAISQVPNSLYFKNQDVIKVTSNVDKSWYNGELNGNIGIIPKNFVIKIDSSSDSKVKQESIQDLQKQETDLNNKIKATKSDDESMALVQKLSIVTNKLDKLKLKGGRIKYVLRQY